MLFTLSFAWALDDSIFFTPGGDPVSYEALVANGTITGRDGFLLARTSQPESLALDPEVASVERRRSGLVRILPRPGVDDLALARRLRHAPGVEWLHPDLTWALRPNGPPDDPWLDQEWHLDNVGQGGRTLDADINAPTAWTWATGAGVLIAVLDTGVQWDHPDLAVIPGHDYLDKDEDPSPDPAYSGGPHGTGAAGIAAAIGDNGYGVAGVAWGAEVYAIRLIGGETSTADLYDSFVEAVDAGAGVLSNSWGFYGCEGVPAAPVFTEMYDYAENNGRGGLGSVVVFAAGNDNCNNSNDAMLGNRYAVVVAASEGDDTRASYSNYGTHLTITAPTGILTTDVTPGGYGSYDADDAFADGFSGTSGATPVVSGVVALMLEANPRLTAKQVRTVLADTAEKIDLEDGLWDEDGFSPYYGYGRVDAGAAVAAVAATAPAAPTPRLLRAEVPADRVFLAWEAAVDPDEDVQRYVVSWWVDGGGEPDEVTTGATELALTGEVEIGDVVRWTVRAEDVWGAGATSAETTFTVVAPLEAPDDEGEDTAPAPEPATCAVSDRSAPLAVSLGALVAATRRRRRVG